MIGESSELVEFIHKYDDGSPVNLVLLPDSKAERLFLL
jgi:hypothetical protein